MDRRLLTVFGAALAVTGLLVAFFSWRHRHMHTMKDGLGILALGIAIMCTVNFDEMTEHLVSVGWGVAVFGALMAVHAKWFVHPHTLKSGIGIAVGGLIVVAVSYIKETYYETIASRSNIRRAW